MSYDYNPFSFVTLIVLTSPFPVGQGLPLLQSSQVDELGNPLPFYNRQMRVGRLPARRHPLRNPSKLYTYALKNTKRTGHVEYARVFTYFACTSF